MPKALALWILLGLGPSSVAIMDPSNEERRMAWKFPGCEHLAGTGRKVEWPAIREALHQNPYPQNMPIIMEALHNLSEGGAVMNYDDEARVCMMGIPALFYYSTLQSVERLEIERHLRGQVSQEDARKVTVEYSVLENYISCLHPGLIDRANWTFTDRQVTLLRRKILKTYRELEEMKCDTGTGGEVSDRPLRIYVYEEDEVPELAPLLKSTIYCSRGQWGTDVQVHDFFRTSTCQTDNPEEADFFFVPGYAICVLEGNIYTFAELDEIYKTLVTALPYFNASGGKDHVFMFGSGMAHAIFDSWALYMPQAIVLTPETEVFNDLAWQAEPPFQTWKDVAVPGSLDLVEVISALSKSKPLAQRRFLAAFYGRADKDRGPHPWVGGVDVRRELIELKKLPGSSDLHFGDGATLEVMHAAYGDAKFCFVPRGKSGWSLRLFEVMFAGCVPVMLSDRWELPFEDFLDVTRFVIKWPSTKIGIELLDYLRSLPDSVVQSYMDEIERVRCWYFYPAKPLDVRYNLQVKHNICPAEQRKDAFRGILRSLLRKRRRSRTSYKSFYFRDATGHLQHVDEDLQPWGRK